MSAESKVGILVLAFIVMVTFFAFKIGGDRFPWQKKEGYWVSVLFDTTAGLQAKSLVRYAGVEVGTVESISLENGKAKVLLMLNPDVQIRSNAEFQISSMGLMGEKYISIHGGTERAKWIEDNDQVSGDAPVSIDQLVTSLNAIGDDIKGITNTVKHAIGSEDTENKLGSIVDNVNRLTESLSGTVDQNNENFTEIIQNFAAISSDLRMIVQNNRDNIQSSMEDIRNITAALSQTLPAISSDLQIILSDLKILINNNQDQLNGTIQHIASATSSLDHTMVDVRSIMGKIDNGQGSLGKMINDTELHDNLNTAIVDLDKTANEIRSFVGNVSDYRLFIGYRGEYLSADDSVKSFISLKMQPSPDKYYLVELVSSQYGQYFEDEYEITFDEDAEPFDDQRFVVTKWERNKLTFSVMYAKIFKNLAFRGGMIESTGGFGVDLEVFRKKLFFSVDAWDLSRDTDPHVKIGATFAINENFYIHGGWDDILLHDRDRDNVFWGAGFRIEDKDLKYLMGFLPLVSGS